MNKRAKFYCGLTFAKKEIEGATITTNTGYEVFKSIEEPTRITHGDKYGFTIGPFRTKRGAEYMRDNPFCGHVNVAEARAKEQSKKG